MNTQDFSLQKIASLLVILALLLLFLDYFQFILVPLCFSGFLAILLLPLQKSIQRLVKSLTWSAVLTLLLVTLFGMGLLTLFGVQLFEVYRDIPDIYGKLQSGLDQLFELSNAYLGLSKNDGQEWLKGNFSKLVETPLNFFGQGLSTSSQLLIYAFLSFLGIFFLLSNRRTLRAVLLLQYTKAKRQKGAELLRQMQNAISQYFSGLLLVIVILAVLNSVGLWLIGVDYPLFFGAVAAFMVIIPYIGTTLGGLLPFLYSLATYTEWWQPLAVVLLYAGIQQIEGNFITPNIIGSSVKINFFVAFAAIILWNALWGVAGIILALPLTALLRILCDYADALKPIGLLLSSDIQKGETYANEKWDADRFRLSTLFKNKKE